MFIDIIVFLLVLAFCALGFREGFIVSALRLAAWVAGVLSVMVFTGSFAYLLGTNLEGISPMLALVCGAFIAFFLPFMLIRTGALIASFFMGKSEKVTFVNRILGGVFGVLKGIIASIFILSVVHLLPAKGNLKASIDNSASYSVYKNIPFAELFGELKTKAEINI